MQKRNTLALILAMLIACGSISVYAFSGRDREKSRDTATPQTSRMERQKAPELTEEQKTEMLEKAKTDLSEKLANGEITQEQYDEALEKLEAGEMPLFGKNCKNFEKGGRHHAMRPQIAGNKISAHNKTNRKAR